MTNQTEELLLKKIKDKTARIGVIGMGYVGLPFAVEKAKVGFKVVGIDQNPKRTEKINRGENYIPDVDDAELKSLVQQGLIRAVSDFDQVAELDVLVIAVPT